MIQTSVVVATYRRKNELKKALDSLAQQDFKDFEIVLVDDNSDDNWNRTVSTIVDEFKNNYPTIAFKYIVNTENKGSAQTRNIGIDASSGEYITFLDDDDIYLPNKIKNQTVFMQTGGYDYSVTDLEFYNENGKLFNRRVRDYIHETTVEALCRYHLMYHLTGTDTMMFKKEYLKKIGGFAPIDVGDEFYLMQRAIDGCGKFGYLPGCDVKAFIHTGEDNLSSGDGKIKGENALYEYKKTYFDKIDAKTKRYIRMRHYAVIAFAEIRRKKIFAFFVNAIKSFICSPIDCVNMFLKIR